MKVSIITPTFNSGKTIRVTLDSVQQQSYVDIEHIIQDGLSNDDTLQIVKEYEHVAKLNWEEDNGIYDAMNKGILSCTGDVIGILNSDDVFSDNQVVLDVVRAFQANKEIDCVYGNITYFKGDSSHLERRKWISRPYFDNYFEEGYVPPHPAVFFRKEVYERIGLYRVDYRVAADYEFLFRALKIKKIKSLCLNRFIVCMRLGGASNAGVKNLLLNNKEVLSVWKLHDVKPPIQFYIRRPMIKIKQYLN